MVTDGQINCIINLLKAFIAGNDRSLGIAGKIEVALDESFPDDDEIQNFVSYFASYFPGGGEYLYDEATMVKKSKVLLTILDSKRGET